MEASQQHQESEFVPQKIMVATRSGRRRGHTSAPPARTLPSPQQKRPTPPPASQQQQQISTSVVFHEEDIEEELALLLDSTDGGGDKDAVPNKPISRSISAGSVRRPLSGSLGNFQRNTNHSSSSGNLQLSASKETTVTTSEDISSSVVFHEEQLELFDGEYYTHIMNMYFCVQLFISHSNLLYLLNFAHPAQFLSFYTCLHRNR